MKKSILFLTILAMFGVSARAQSACKFVSKDVIFPGTGGDGSVGLFRITETTTGPDSDDSVELEITFHQPKDNGNYVNDYYIMSYVAPNAYASSSGTNRSSTSITGGGDTTLATLEAGTSTAARIADTAVLFTTHNLKINDGVCNELDCYIKYNLLFEVGAAPNSDGCTTLSRSGKAAVYVRAHYHFKLEIHYNRVDGKVDFSNWNNVVATTDVLLTQEDVLRAMEFTAENIMSVAQFQLASDFKLDGDTAGACLSAASEAQNSTAVENNDPGSAEYDNGLTRCTARGFATIEQIDPQGSTPGAVDDSDTDSANQDLLYYESGYVEMWISQYSQMGDTPDCNGEHTSIDEPTFNQGTAGQARKCSTGNDYRLDVCHVKGQTSDQVSSVTGEREFNVTDADKDNTAHFSTYTFTGSNPADDLTDAYIDGSSSTPLSDDLNAVVQVADDFTDINAFVACQFQLDPPTSCDQGGDVCTYTPLFYLAAWFDESIPVSTSNDVDHGDYTDINESSNTVVDQHEGGESTTGGGEVDGDPYSPARRLRSAPKLLRAAAQRKLAEPQGTKRVHFMRVHLTHKH